MRKYVAHIIPRLKLNPSHKDIETHTSHGDQYIYSIQSCLAQYIIQQGQPPKHHMNAHPTSNTSSLCLPY